MADDLKGLIEKIQQEGIQAAETQARQIEGEARLSAKNIIEDAKKEADKMMASAKEQIALANASAAASLRQAARNTLIALRQEIASMLHTLIALDVRKCLAPEELLKIIVKLLVGYRADAENEQIVISLNKEDLECLEKSLLAELKEEVKSKVVLKASDEVKAGFIISYDAGKSHFDFTDEALTEYISVYLDQKLNQVLKDSLKSREIK